MIYTLTLNPAVDYRMNICDIEYGRTNRSSSEAVSFGGKGINVSKVLKNLGIESKALGFCAGFTGRALTEHLDECGISHDFISLESGNTRINIKLCDEKSVETEINAKGPQVLEREMQMLFEKIKSTVLDGDTLVLSGSVPAGADEKTYASIMELVRERNARVIVDATGGLLKNTLCHKPFLVKPNISELSGLFGETLCTKDEVIENAKKLKAMGAQNVLVSMGGDGALLVNDKEEVLAIGAHKGKAINTVGAGDSMVAGFIAGADAGYEYALRLANACGGATAFSHGLATKDAIDALLEKPISMT